LSFNLKNNIKKDALKSVDYLTLIAQIYNQTTINMSSITHINTGIRKILEHPSIYNSFQDAIGGNKQRKEHFLTYFKNTQNKNILDIGCGTAVLLEYIEDTADYHGCDMEESYINYCIKKYGDRGSFYTERVGEVVREEWLSYFDIINAHGLLHHLNDNDSKDLLDISYKYLKPGGILVTVDSVFHKNQSSFAKWLISKDRGQNVRTPEAYLALAKQHFPQVDGFIDDKAYRIPYSLYTMIMKK